MVLPKIIHGFHSVYIHTLLNCYNYEYALIRRLTRIYSDCYFFFISTFSSLIFVIYLAIPEEYFSYLDSCLGELFDKKQYSIRQIRVIPTKACSDQPKNAATHPIGVQKSIHPQQSINRIKARKTLPYPCQTNDSRPSQQFRKSPRIRAKNVAQNLVFMMRICLTSFKTWRKFMPQFMNCSISMSFYNVFLAFLCYIWLFSLRLIVVHQRMQPWLAWELTAPLPFGFG